MQEWSPISQFLERPPRVIQDSLINEFNLTLRGHGTSQTGHAIDDQAKIAFTLTEGLFRALPLGDFCDCSYELNATPRVF